MTVILSILTGVFHCSQELSWVLGTFRWLRDAAGSRILSFLSYMTLFIDYHRHLGHWIDNVRFIKDREETCQENTNKLRRLD